LITFGFNVQAVLCSKTPTPSIDNVALKKYRVPSGSSGVEGSGTVQVTLKLRPSKGPGGVESHTVVNTPSITYWIGSEAAERDAGPKSNIPAAAIKAVVLPHRGVFTIVPPIFIIAASGALLQS
jgi:hypothetical protein